MRGLIMKNKVLLIDDSVTIHRVIDLSIDLEKYDLVKVFSQEAAFSKLKELNFDFILMDNKLENTNIADYAKEIKSLQPVAKLILLVGAFDKIDADYITNLGAEDFLVKPFDSQSLNTKLTLSEAVKQMKAEEAAKSQKNEVVKETKDEKKNSVYCDMAQKPQMESMFAPKPPIKEEAPKIPITQQRDITKPVNNMPIFHDPSEDPPKAAAGGKQVLSHSSNPFNDDETESQKKDKGDNQFQKEKEFGSLSPDASNRPEKNQENEFALSPEGAFAPQADENNSYEFAAAPADAFASIGETASTRSGSIVSTYDAFSPQSDGNDDEQGEVKFQEEKLFNYGDPQETPKNEQQKQENFGGVGVEEQTGGNNDYQDFRGENRFKQITDEDGTNIGGTGIEGKEGNTDFLDFRTENSSIHQVQDNENSETTPPQPEISQVYEPQTDNHAGKQETSSNETLIDENIMQTNAQTEAISYEQENSPEKENEAMQMINETIKTQEENNEDDFYKLDEDDIFSPKPVGQLFETEILSIATAKEEKHEEDRPLAQKFEEEVLSIDEPTPEDIDYSSLMEAPAGNFFETPVIVEEVPKKEEYKKSISQKFEEEILSIEDPAENLFKLGSGDNGKTALNETFDNEILLISDPEEKIAPNLHDDEPDEDMQRLENELFAKTITPQNTENHLNTKPIVEKQDLDEDLFDARAFMKEVDSPIPSKNDDFFHDKSLVKEFADDFFPKDETSDNFNFDDDMETKTIDDDDFFANKDDDLFASKNNDFKPNDSFKDDVVPQTETVLPDDDSLDLDTLLNMDLSKPSQAPLNRRVSDFKTETSSPQARKPASIESVDDDFFMVPPSAADVDDEDPFAGIDNISSTNIEEFKEHEETHFDVVEAEHTKSTKIQNNIENNVLSGITVTISKEEIMKMIGNALDRDFLEKAVQGVLAQNMREIVRSVVPAIAEKFIKEEIEKLKDEDEGI